LLGETFEYYDREMGVKFLAEQVSHHPPIGASFISSDQFLVEFFLGVETKFTGNAVTSRPFAGTRITLKATGSQYVYQGITSVAHNILIGNRWVDIYGKVSIKEIGSTRYCVLNCKECDFFSSNWHQVTGLCYKEQKNRVFLFEGKWNEKVLCQKVVSKDTTTTPSLTPTKVGSKKGSTSLSSSKIKKEGTPEKESKIKLNKSEDGLITKIETNTNAVQNFDDGKTRTIWSNNVDLCPDKPYTNWDMTKIARKAVMFSEEFYFSKELPPTDSRYRPDRIAVENLDYDTAETEKGKLEIQQRKEKEDRDTNKDNWGSKYFENVKLDAVNGMELYTYKNNYPNF